MNFKNILKTKRKIGRNIPSQFNTNDKLIKVENKLLSVTNKTYLE